MKMKNETTDRVCKKHDVRMRLCHSASGDRPYCHLCALDRSRKRFKEVGHGSIYRESHQHANRKVRYKISGEQFESLLKQQGGRCALCRTKFSEEFMKRPRVDHCHRSGRIRGLLCHRCNSGLGFLNDSPKLLLKAIAYLGGQA